MSLDFKAMSQTQDPYNVTLPGKESNFVFKVPEGEDKALIVKFLVDPRGNGRRFIPVKYYPHLVGPNPDMDTRYHIGQDLAGNGKDIELEARIGYYKELKALRTTGSTDAARMQQLTKLVERCKDKEMGWFFIVEPASSAIKAVKLGISVINQLFGRTYQDKEPIPSLINQVSAKGVSPYDIYDKNPELGWFKIYSTGKGLGKKYHVKLAETVVTKVVDGETYTKSEPARYPLHDKIKNADLTLADFPDPLAMEVKQAFTMAETEAFIKSAYTQVPERFLKRNETGAVQRQANVTPVDNYLPDVSDLDNLGVQEVELTDLPF